METCEKRIFFIEPMEKEQERGSTGEKKRKNNVNLNLHAAKKNTMQHGLCLVNSIRSKYKIRLENLRMHFTLRLGRL